MDKDTKSISEFISSNDVLDIDFLKNSSLDFLHKISGKTWTDFNLHDPGVTSLEIICLAINELIYRSNFDISEIIDLTTNGKIDCFIDNESIGDFNPLTNSDIINELKKIDNIDNLYLKKDMNLHEFKGVYNVFVETNLNSKNDQNFLRQKIIDRLSAIRNISTIYNKINFLESEYISFNLKIEINDKVEPSKLLFDISKKLNEACENDYTLVDYDYDYLYVSDVISSIMKIDKIKSIEDIKLIDDKGKSYNWRYKGKKDSVLKINHKNSDIIITYKNKIFFTSNLSDLTNHNEEDLIDLDAKKKLIEKSNIFDFGSYNSIQNDFPKNYGISSYGVSRYASDIEKASAKQFKGFMFIFDQILCNSFAQLSYINKLYSFKEINNTKNTDIINDFPSLYVIYKPFIDQYFLKNFHTNDDDKLRKEWRKYYSLNKNKIAKKINKISETKIEFLKRRNEVLNHILARFGFDLISYEAISLLSKEELITYKLNILNNLSTLSGKRSNGCISVHKKIYSQFGLKKYLYLLLGFRHDSKQYLTHHFINYNSRKESIDIQFPFKRAKSISLLLKNAQEESNYKKIENNKYKLLLEDEKFAKINLKSSGIQLIDVINKIKYLDAQSEGLYVIDHLLLAPKSEYRVFSFYFTLDDKKLFESNYYNRKKRDQIIYYFIKTINNEDCFVVSEVNMNQFVINWTYKDFLLKGCEFFKCKNDAEKAVQNMLVTFSNTKDFLSNNIFRTTKFNTLYNECQDPFSNIVSILIPNWTYRFQNNAFRKFVEETILKELPAHIVCFIKWLNFDEMHHFEIRFNEYQDSLINGNINTREKSLDILMQTLIS